MATHASLRAALVAADRLADRMRHHAICERHTLEQAQGAVCPQCRDRAVWRDYQRLRGASLVTHPELEGGRGVPLNKLKRTDA